MQEIANNQRLAERYPRLKKAVENLYQQPGIGNLAPRLKELAKQYLDALGNELTDGFTPDLVVLTGHLIKHQYTQHQDDKESYAEALEGELRSAAEAFNSTHQYFVAASPVLLEEDKAFIDLDKQQPQITLNEFEAVIHSLDKNEITDEPVNRILEDTAQLARNDPAANSRVNRKLSITAQNLAIGGLFVAALYLFDP